MSHSLLYFILAAAVFTMTPGIDTAMVLRTSMRSGHWAGISSASGICLGLLLWGLGTALGLTSLLAASQLAFAVVKWLGAAYLVYLGLHMLIKPRSEAPGDISEEEMSERNRKNYLVRGFFTNILNPKVGLFYMTFLPQFIPHGAHVAQFSMLLAGIHVTMTMIWFVLLAALTMPLNQFLGRPQVVRNLDRLTGTIFISFGIKLALADRS